MKNKIPNLFFLIIIAIISILLFLGNYWKENIINFPAILDIVLEEPQKAIVYYKDIGIDKIYLDNDVMVYSLEKGDVFRNSVKLDPKSNKEKINRVLRLSLFYQWIKEDPLFASSSFNTGKFSGSVTHLKAKEKELLDKYKWTDPIFATKFLEGFITSSESYQKFLSEVSEKNAALLIENMDKANDEYFLEAAELKETIARSIITNPSGKDKYAFLGGETVTDLNIISSDLDKIGENSKLVREEINARKECLYKSLSSCRRPLENFTEPRKNDNLQNNDLVLIPKSEIGFGGGKDYSGPYEINSPCWKNQNGDKQYLYVHKQCPAGSICSEKFHLATNTYFQKLTDHIPRDKYLKDQGVEVAPRPEAAPYMCPNEEYQPKLATIDYFYTKFKDNRFYEKLRREMDQDNFTYDLKKIIDEGITAEKMFFDVKYPSEDSLEYLAKFYAFTYGYLMKKDQIIDPGIKEELLTRYLLIKEKTIDSDLILNTVILYFSSFIENYSFTDTLPPQGYIYPIRSDYSFIFFNFSSSVWRSKQKLQYLVRGDDNIAKENSLIGGVMNYNEAVAKYGKENIEKWRGIYNQYMKKTDKYP